MNDFDKAGRYQIKRDPDGVFGWLLQRAVAFQAWIDARRLALPDQGDLANDLVAAFRVGDGFEALCVELQAASDSASASRLLLGYVPRLLTEPATSGSLPLTAAGGLVINLTGPPQPAGVEQRLTLAPACWLAGGIEQRTLRDEDAAATVRGVTAGRITPWLLPWLPLMRGGADAGIIKAWKRAAARRLRGRDRQILALLTMTFADLGRCRAEWARGLEGWAVMKSAYLDELREQVRTEAKAEGRLQELRETVLCLGRQRFASAPSRPHKAQLNAVTDLSRLQRIRDRLLEAASWADLLATP